MHLFSGEKKLKDTMEYAGDYETVLRKDKKGRMRKKAVYKGHWFFVLNEKKACRLYMFASAGLSVLCFVLLLAAQLVNFTCDGCGFVTIPLVLSLFPALFTLFSLEHLPFGAKPMERAGYMNGIIRISRLSAVSAILSGVSVAAEFVYRAVVSLWDFTGKDILHLLFSLAAAASAVSVILILHRIEISEHENEDYMP